MSWSRITCITLAVLVVVHTLIVSGQEASRGRAVAPVFDSAAPGNAILPEGGLRASLDPPHAPLIQNLYFVGHHDFGEEWRQRNSIHSADRMKFLAVIANEPARPERKIKGLRIDFAGTRRYLDAPQIDELIAGIDQLSGALAEWDRVKFDADECSVTLATGDLRFRFSRVFESPGRNEFDRIYGEDHGVIESASGKRVLAALRRDDLTAIKRLAERCQAVLASDNPAAAAREAVTKEPS